MPLDAAEFRQGPNEVVDDRFAAALFMPHGQPGARNRTLAAEIARLGGRVLMIGETDAADTESNPERLRAFPIAGLPDAVRPILEVAPLQALAYHLAAAQGYTPGEVRYITKVIVNEDAFPLRAIGLLVRSAHLRRSPKNHRIVGINVIERKYCRP